MNRRDFTRALASLSLSPALPLQAASAITTGTAVAGATAEKMYFVSWYTARLNKTCSTEMLVSELKMNPEVAKEVFSKLVRSNTVSAPNVFGVSRTISPLSNSYAGMARKAASRAGSGHAKPVERMDLRKVERFASQEDQQLETPFDELPDTSEDASKTLAAEPLVHALNAPGHGDLVSSPKDEPSS